MEEKEKFEDFKDFDEEEATLPELEKEEINEEEPAKETSFEDSIDELQQTIMNQYKDHFSQDNLENSEQTEENIEIPNLEQEETQSLNSKEETVDELSIPAEEFEEESEKEIETKEEISQWEELSEDNSVVKKYIMYISKDYVPIIDSLSIDERMAYINDAIQMKIDFEDEEKQKIKKQKIRTHLFLTILTFCIMSPIALLGVNKAIMATFENYKYSQENFEKLYRQRFQKDRAYMRSIQYNKEQELKKQNKDK